MAWHTRFNQILDRLYLRRTDWLRSLLTSGKPGRPLALTKERRERKIRELREIASKALAKKMARKEFKRFKLEKRPWRTKGWGKKQKLRMFRAWVREKLPARRSGKVYVFWAGSRCQYVGRTIGRGYRPTRKFNRPWFRKTTRIDFYLTRKRSATPSLECLAIHRIRPAYNRIRAAKKSWTPRCPLCKVHKKIGTEIRKIYRFR